MRRMTRTHRHRHHVFAASWPGSTGTIELTDKRNKLDKRVIAELKITLPTIRDTVSTIKFLSTTNQ